MKQLSVACLFPQEIVSSVAQCFIGRLKGASADLQIPIRISGVKD